MLNSFNVGSAVVATIGARLITFMVILGGFCYLTRESHVNTITETLSLISALTTLVIDTADRVIQYPPLTLGEKCMYFHFLEVILDLIPEVKLRLLHILDNSIVSPENYELIQDQITHLEGTERLVRGVYLVLGCDIRILLENANASPMP